MKKYNEYVLRFISDNCLQENLPIFYSVEKYANNYKIRLKEYLSQSPESEEIDFLEKEIKSSESVLAELSKPLYSYPFENMVGYENFSILLNNRLNKRLLLLEKRKKEISLKFSLSTPTLVDYCNESDQNPTKILIQEQFENISHKGWEYAFYTIDDYKYFVDTLSAFFQFQDYEISKKIELRRMTKTKVAKILNEIYRELGNMQLSQDKNFFCVVRTLNHFSNLSDTELYKTLLR
ncbi:hypothetical protein [Chryseobacterium luquanense]|uniref:Lantibiotic dehydratase N-terminal domain-containing protein n=1 Tax=Chryseobacterium luquanense TaxID=2983766 RepID=A0ABT3Y8B3_9FLAO|nr:hypothetical protein [Chryseobacterium luquanense]MCX8534333.1 hypothetical protein [Chryseobacterium luquanense]